MSVLTIAPALVVFFAAQRYFIEGISSGGVKG
jgi:oligogalacturonide transport system permease protein